MKHHIFSHKQLIFCSLALILTSWNGSMVDTSGKNKRPDVNFYGELTDHNATCKVEDILIGGKYEDIYVYEPIKTAKTALEKLKTDSPKSEIDPTQNKIKIDLHNTTSIELVYPDKPIEHEFLINNRKYIEIEVTSITGSKEKYFIESSREISCLKIDKGPNQDQQPITKERKLTFIQMTKLIIKGYKGAQDAVKPNYRDSHDSQKAEIATSTEKILDQIEEKVNNLPKEDSNYDKLKQSLLSLLRSLRDQLQKMLSMIKN